MRKGAKGCERVRKGAKGCERVLGVCTKRVVFAVIESEAWVRAGARVP